jgi:hypothetical protein
MIVALEMYEYIFRGSFTNDSCSPFGMLTLAHLSRKVGTQPASHTKLLPGTTCSGYPLVPLIEAWIQLKTVMLQTMTRDDKS